LEVFGQVRPGDVLTKQSRLVDVFEKDGRSGTMLFSVRETRVTNQSDDLVCIDRVTTAAVPQRPEPDTDSVRPGPTQAPAHRGAGNSDTAAAWETERRWNEVAEDDEIATMHRTVTPVQVFLFGAVRMNSHQIHYDRDYAQREGLRERVAHGDLLGDLLCQLVTRWMGRTGMLRRYSYEVRAPGFVGETIAHLGKVTRRWRDDDGRGLVELELRAEGAGGRLCLRGAATVELDN
ncbi:MAG: MaoC family dehydratase N-terminal domain-containing protein, partial [Chloroflexi bacterium]|nr:MaoC family dehydratase N-terminal domain-containing protein [Chloroflexota bacterium]